MLKLYSDRTHYRRIHRAELFVALRPSWKDAPVSADLIRQQYGDIVDVVSVVDDERESDAWVLPMSWNFYSATGQRALALSFIERARQSAKPVLTWVSGDFGVTPAVRDVVVLRPSGYRSTRLPNQHALPVFVDDPLEGYSPSKAVSVREKAPRPIVGFCGQAWTSRFRSVLDLARIVHRNAAYHLGLSFEEPQTPYPAAWLRHSVLRRIEKSAGLHPNFIRRNRYRAGARTPEDRQRSTREFWDNIAGSDYTVCIRGGGNFSARLYETLAMGRVPIFVDTDCLLPFDRWVDWKRVVVWIDERDLKRLPEIVLDHHTALHPDDFKQAQLDCRRFWEEKLSFGGFFATFADRVVRGEAA